MAVDKNSKYKQHKVKVKIDEGLVDYLNKMKSIHISLWKEIGNVLSL